MKCIYLIFALSFFLLILITGFVSTTDIQWEDIATVESIIFDLEEQGVGIVTIKVSEVVEYEELPTQPGKFELMIKRAKIPKELEVIRDVSAFASPVRSITSFNSPEGEPAVMILVELKGLDKEEVLREVRWEGNLLIMKFSKKTKSKRLNKSFYRTV